MSENILNKNDFVSGLGREMELAVAVCGGVLEKVRENERMMKVLRWELEKKLKSVTFIMKSWRIVGKFGGKFMKMF